MLESLQRRDDLRREALALQTDLIQGRWHLDRATYQLHAEEVWRWTGTDVAATGANGHLELASVVETLWNDWRRQAPDRRAGAGRRVIETSNTRITVVWAGTQERLSAFLVAPAFIERQWLTKVTPALDRQHMRVALGETAREIGRAHV